MDLVKTTGASDTRTETTKMTAASSNVMAYTVIFPSRIIFNFGVY